MSNKYKDSRDKDRARDNLLAYLKVILFFMAGAIVYMFFADWLGFADFGLRK